jgi:hypothetical protein
MDRVRVITHRGPVKYRNFLHASERSTAELCGVRSPRVSTKLRGCAVAMRRTSVRSSMISSASQLVTSTKRMSQAGSASGCRLYPKSSTRRWRPENLVRSSKTTFLKLPTGCLAMKGSPSSSTSGSVTSSWVGYFAGGFLGLYLSDVKRTVMQAYCRFADALLGGNCAEQFTETRKRRIAELKEQNQLV